MIQRQHEKQKGDSVKLILIITAMLLTLFACGSQARADDIARQARHLLAQKCFLCHGPDRNSEDAQETDLRLDLREVALEYEALVAGDAAASEMLTRVTSQDPDSQVSNPRG